jgi:hypothetical protein
MIEDLRSLLAAFDPKARADLRRILIRDQAAHDARLRSSLQS